MNLFKAEWNRLASRRFTKVALILVILALGLIAAGVFLGNHKVTEADRVAARAQVAAELVRMQQECAANPPPAGTDAPSCKEMTSRNAPQEEWYLPSEFSFKDYAPPMIMVFGALLCLYAFLVGASYIGAEWSSGGVMNLLLWRPRRAPTLLGKYAALLTGLTVSFVGLGALWAAALYLIADLRGNFTGVTPGVITSLALAGLRTLALVLAVGIFGFAVASLGRRTAAALGTAVGVILLGEVGARIVLGLFRVPRMDRYMLSNYVIAWMEKKMSFVDYSACVNATGPCREVKWEITMGDSAVVFGIGLILVTGAAFYSFTRRDIT